MKKIKLFAMTLMSLMATGAMAAGSEIFSFTVTSATTATGTYQAVGGSAQCSGSAMATGGSNEITIGTQTFYKFNSSSEWIITLSKNTISAGDVISFVCASQSSSAKKGKGILLNGETAIKGDFPAGETNTLTYTVVAGDGIAGTSSFSFKRNDSDVKFGTVTVTHVDAANYPYVKSFTMGEIEAAIDTTAHTITAELPYGTDRADAISNAVVVMGGTAKTYSIAGDVLTAIDTASASKNIDYSLTGITVKSSASTDATLKDLKFRGTTVKGFAPTTLAYYDTLLFADKGIAIEDMEFELNDASAVASAVTLGMTEGDSTLSVTITAQDATTKLTYVIQVNRLAASSEKAITSFMLNGIVGTINEAEHTIAVDYPTLLGSVTKLLPVITVSPFATVAPTDSMDFSTPVTYTVTAQNGEQQPYVVTVNAKEIAALPVSEMPYVSVMNSAWSIPNWMCVISTETTVYNPSYLVTGGSDKACAVDSGAIRIHKTGAVYVKAEKCDSIIAYFSGTGDRKFRISVVGGDSTVTVSSKKNIRNKVLLDVESENPVVLKIDMDGANGGGTISGINVYWTEKSGTNLQNINSGVKTEKFIRNGVVYFRKDNKIFNALGQEIVF